MDYVEIRDGVPYHKFMEHPYYIGYVYNRWLRMEARKSAKLFFNPMDLDVKRTSAQELL